MTTQQATSSIDAYAADFARLDVSSPIHALRAAAFDRFAQSGFPTRRDERWRHTNIKPITETVFRPAGDDTPTIAVADLQRYRLTETECHQLVFINGAFSRTLSSIDDLDASIRVDTLARALRTDADFVRDQLDRAAELSGEAFTALNTAFVEDGAVVHLPKNAVLDRPVHLLFATLPSAHPVISHPRVLIVAEACSQATIVETYAGISDGASFTNTVTEILAGDGANIDHYKVERENDSAAHVSSLNIRQLGNTRITSHNICVSGRLTRNDVNAALDAEGCNATFNGLFLGRDTQHIDNHLRVDHLKPNCNSWEFYKGVLDDKSSAVFSGRIYVAEDAQKTDAKQTNMNLLLSDEAHIDTKPQLEIFADDVKCTHGATIGQLNEDQLFYLMARGIDREAARSLLIFAFANETISEIRVPELRDRLTQILLKRLPQSDILRIDQ